MAINPNDYEFRVWYEQEEPDEEGSFLAQVVEWPHVMADGQSPEEAVAMLREVLSLSIESNLRTGNPIPPPARRSLAKTTHLHKPKALVAA